MKNLIQYLKLWQKKRDQLRVDTDANSDWLDMNALLDKHMPVSDNSGGSSPKKGISLFTTMLITLSAAAMFYVGHTIIETKKKAAYNNNKLHHKRHRFLSEADSLATSDSLQQTEDQLFPNDSTSAIQNTTANAAASVSASNENNSKSSIKPDSINSRTTSTHLNDKGKTTIIEQNSPQTAASSHLYDNKTLRLADERGKGESNVRTNQQVLTLSSNSYGALNKFNHVKKPNSASSGNNTQFNPATTLSDQFNNNGFHTETNLNVVNRNSQLLILPTGKSVGVNRGLVNNYQTLNDKSLPQPNILASATSPRNRVKPTTHINVAALDWGILIGANSNGSFTSGSLNKNFYGSLPVDVFTGIYGTYNLNGKWGIGTQIALLTPQIAKGGTYSRPYLFYTDSNVTTKHKLVSNPKKIYSVQLPIYVTYKVAQNINLKAGPVISFPIKQGNATQIDSVSRDLINHSHYDQKIDYSLAGGVNYQYKRLIFEVNYLKGLKQHSIVADSLIHRSSNNTFQFSIKLQLGGNKK